MQHEDLNIAAGGGPTIEIGGAKQQQATTNGAARQATAGAGGRKAAGNSLPKSRSTGAVFDGNLTSAEAQQVIISFTWWIY